MFNSPLVDSGSLSAPAISHSDHDQRQRIVKHNSNRDPVELEQRCRCEADPTGNGGLDPTGDGGWDGGTPASGLGLTAGTFARGRQL